MWKWLAKEASTSRMRARGECVGPEAPGTRDVEQRLAESARSRREDRPLTAETLPGCYKAEHAVDLDTGAIVHAELNEGDQADGTDLANHMEEVEARLDHSLIPATGPIPDPSSAN